MRGRPGVTCGPTHATGRTVCRQWVRIGPVDVEASLWVTTSAGLVRAHFWFDARQYPALREIFVDRYGAPTDRREEPVQTPGGGQFVNEVLQWEGATAAVSLERFADSIKHGEAVIQTAADRAEQQARARDTLKKGKNDL